MAYSLEKYGIKVNGTSNVQVVDREDGAVQKTVELSTQNAVIFLEEGDEDFDVVGTFDQEGEYVSTVNPTVNDIQLTTDAELIHIGGSGASIELATMNAYICVSGSNMSFYEQDREQQSIKKAA